MHPLFIRLFILLGLFLPALASANTFTICNQSGVPISAALARLDSDASTSTFSSYGWYNISPGACSLVSSTSTNYRFFYVYAEGGGGKVWNDSSMSNPACVDPINSFHIINAGANCATRSYQQKGFISVDTGNSAAFTYNITATPAVSPALSLTGLWWNQNESGWGISLTQQGSMVFAAWFTYGPTGQPAWLVMSSCLVIGNACMGDIYKVVGGTKLGVPWNGAGKVVTKVGVGTLTFADNNTGTLNYSVDGVSGTKQITRQIFATGSSQPAIDYSALWWNENESGWGVAITQQYGMIFAIMYTYDTSGNPVWYVASGCPLSGDNCTGDLYKVTGGSEPNVTWNDVNKMVAKVGTVSFVFNDSSTGVMSYVINGVSGSKAISRQLFGEPVAATYQSAYDACYIGTPLLYTSNYCSAYANAIVAGSTPLVANQAGAVAAGSNVGNIGMGGAITVTGTPYVPNAGPTPTPTPTPPTSFSGTYDLTSNDGTTASITFDSAGSVTSCKVGTVVVCSGKLTLSSSSGTASFQISGNDGLNPIDTTASLSGTIATNGNVSGSFSGNSASEGAFSGTFTGSKVGGANGSGQNKKITVAGLNRRQQMGTLVLGNYGGVVDTLLGKLV